MKVTMHTLAGAAIALIAVPGAIAQPFVEVFPNLPHAASNTIPLGFSSGNTGITVHQVYAATLFSAVTSGQPAQITRLALAPTGSGTFNANLAVRLGYTSAVPGVLPPTGLDLPDIGGGGAPNATGSMHLFYSAPTVHVVAAPGSENFQFVIDGTPFTYDPALGNLLLEIVVTEQLSGISVSRAAGSEQASRAYRRINGSTSLTTTQAHRTQFTFTAVGPVCYPDCDGDDALTLADFGCFQTKFALGDLYADCNGDAVLNLADFGCFQTAFALGCP